MIKTINQRITNTDLFVFNYNPTTGIYTYSRPLSKAEATALAEQTNRLIETEYNGVSGLKVGLAANDAGEIYNMSALKGIVANRILMKKTEKTDNPQRLPIIQEGVLLQNAGMLSSGILIDHGLAVYNNGNPDQEIAQALTQEATQKNYTLPLLASFSSLDLKRGGKRYGVTPTIVSTQGLVYGTHAQKLLDENSFIQGKNGVHWLGRGGSGRWFTSWGDNLDDFSEGCRVGRVSAEGSAKKLEEEALGAFASIRQSLDEILASCK